MALPVTLTSAAVGFQNSYHGPFKSSEGKFYAITISPTATDQIAAWMATDPTDSFAVQDSSAEPDTGASAIISLWVFQEADILYVAVQTLVDDVYHAQFNMAADAWVEITVGNTEDLVVDLASEAQTNAVSIAIEESSSNEIVITYQGNPSDNKDMGGSFDWVAYAVSDDVGVGASWSTGNAVADTNDASEVDFTGPVIVRGTDGVRMHIFFKDDTNNDGYQRTLADPGGTPSLETFPSAFDSDVSGVTYIVGPGVLLDDIVYCPYLGPSATTRVRLASFTSADVPFVTHINIGDNAPNSNSSGIALDGSDIHLLYTHISTDNVFHDIDTGSGWGTDVDILNGSGAITIVSPNIYDRDGPKLAYIYDDGGTIKYNELPLTHTFALLSDVNMGKQNSFHGPFETQKCPIIFPS